MIAAYYVAEILLAVLSIVLPRVNRLTLVTAGVILLLAAGLRTGGFDYQNYVNAIEFAHASSSKSVLVQLVIVKDPLMLAVIHICRMFSQGTRLVFLVMTGLAVVPKVVAAKSLGSRSTLFLVLYATLLAPGLEFEAMRAAVALGFLLLLITCANRRTLLRWTLAVVSVAAHVAALPFVAPRLFQRVKGRVLVALLPAAIAIAAYAGSSLVWLFPRSEGYQNDLGTVRAFLPSVATYVAYLVTNAATESVGPEGLAATGNVCAAIAIGLGIGLAPAAVTVAIRFLEYGWAFVVLVAVARDSYLPQLQPPRVTYHMLAVAWMAATILTANALRSVLAIPL